MNSQDILTQLLSWTPYLLEGFLWNILIAVSAMVLGTFIGGLLAWGQADGSDTVSRLSQQAANFFFKLPTVAMLFYVAVLLPVEIQLPWSTTVHIFPTWIKAALALSVAQVGFTAQNLTQSIRFWHQGEHGAAMLFFPNWGSNLLITIIASSSASLVGVNELITRCNTLINAQANTALMIPLYLYASLFFLLFCFPLTLAMKTLKQHMTARYLPHARQRDHKKKEQRD
jgi:polar amino acid transport system permease protein